ncbi:sensor domain-containing diguanylate cyclase [Chloroflexia bacterium SDU3-3]|nr:sensor domain-containing diguanylate cyclase [Chloroflexia bacterium SDU3-3]
MEAILTTMDCLTAILTGALGMGLIAAVWRDRAHQTYWQCMIAGTLIVAYAFRQLADALSGMMLCLSDDGSAAARLLWDTMMLLPPMAYILFSSRLVPRAATLGLSLSHWRQAEAKLQQENAQLAATVRALELRTEQMRSMNELSELFQAAQTLEEIGAITRRMACDLLPVDAGAIYVADTPGAEPQLLVAWGMHAAPGGLRGALAYTSAPTALAPPQPKGWLRVPLRSQADVWGALVLHLPEATPAAPDDPLEQATAWLVQALADQAAFAVANLAMRTSLREQAMHDPLTGLCNRRSMELFFSSEIGHAAQQHSSVGVLLIDIDYFKRINDTYGHLVGDDALRLVARALKDSSRRSDVVCRYGGEEFVVILPDVSAPVLAARAEQLRTAIAQVAECGELPIRSITASVGIALYPQHGDTTTAVLASADAALYAAKQRGRDQWVLADYP